MKEALIIFVRKPEKGKVKTRIAAAVGDDMALSIYKKLLQHTYSITHVLPCDKYVYYAGAIEENDLWQNGYYKDQQADTGLGLRMQIAFTQLFRKGYERICIIGSDCHELTTEIIKEAFELLTDNDIIIGPAHDGGYYLLAMKESVKSVFEGIEWSTEKVLIQTLVQIKKHHYSYSLLPELKDMDTIQDVPEEWLII
ncbi:MAG: TIGR04282 family arsenosugar biosynthesis glycosyltransferase [Flavisolibacter sp.]|nr:TIGR04282 family arsenosugar biosynthesis glycosyltransferase [Flavisolibacter sp.]